MFWVPYTRARAGYSIHCMSADTLTLPVHVTNSQTRGSTGGFSKTNTHKAADVSVQQEDSPSEPSELLCWQFPLVENKVEMIVVEPMLIKCGQGQGWRCASHREWGVIMNKGMYLQLTMAQHQVTR